MSTLLESVQNAVETEVQARVQAAVEAATANFHQVGSPRPRVLSFPDGQEEITLSELLAFNNVTIDLDNMTTVVATDHGNKAVNGDTAVRSGDRIVAGAVEPNG